MTGSFILQDFEHCCSLPWDRKGVGPKKISHGGFGKVEGKVRYLTCMVGSRAVTCGLAQRALFPVS